MSETGGKVTKTFMQKTGGICVRSPARDFLPRFTTRKLRSPQDYFRPSEVLKQHPHYFFYHPAQFHRMDAFDCFKQACLDFLARWPSNLNQEAVRKQLQISDVDWVKHYNEYTSYRASQQKLLKDATIESSLSQAFAKLPKLDSIVMGHFFDCTLIGLPGGRFVAEPAQMRKVTQKTLLRPMIEATIYPRDVKLSLSAPSDAKVKLKHTYRDFVPHGFFTSTNAQDPKCNESLASSIPSEWTSSTLLTASLCKAFKTS